jgi:hypothetical protein
MPSRHRWRPALALAVRYLAVATLGHALWEAGQLPLYTLWSLGTPREILTAYIHCSGGDVLIAVSTLSIAAALTRACRGPVFGPGMVWTAVLLGVAYTILSEWLNVSVRGSWAYAPAMPVLPGIGTGLAPLLQWLVVPFLAFALTLRYAAKLPKRLPPSRR